MLSVTLVFGSQSCYYDNEEELYPCVTNTVSYSRDIQPILSSNCYTCHASSASKPPDTKFDTYESFARVVNNPESKILCRINWESGCNRMPANGSKLSMCSIKFIEAWIADGAKNN